MSRERFYEEVGAVLDRATPTYPSSTDPVRYRLQKVAYSAWLLVVYTFCDRFSKVDPEFNIKLFLEACSVREHSRKPH